MRSTIALGALALLAAALPPPAAEAAPLADLKAATATALKVQKDYDKGRVAAFAAAIGVISDQVRLGLITPADGLEAAANAAFGCLTEVLAKAIAARIDVTTKAQTIIATDGVGTPGFLIGDGGALDQFQTKLNGELEKSRKQVEKRLRAYAATVTKATDGGFRHTVLVPPLRMDVGPAPNTPPISTVFEDIIHPSRLLIGIAGSNRNVGNDGKACFGGRAYLNFGTSNVNIQLFGTVVRTNTNVAIEGGTGRWQTCFTGLPLGNFHIAFDQDPDQDAVVGETVTEYATIGVP
jgi:hypothetical protein